VELMETFADDFPSLTIFQKSLLLLEVELMETVKLTQDRGKPTLIASIIGSGINGNIWVIQRSFSGSLRSLLLLEVELMETQSVSHPRP